eukprot:gene13142-biopygen14073
MMSVPSSRARSPPPSNPPAPRVPHTMSIFRLWEKRGGSPPTPALRMAISRACPPVLRGRTKNVDASVPNSTVVSHDDGIPCGTGPTSLDTVSKVDL